MSKLMIKIHNSETGEIIEREMTNDEIADLEISKSEIAAIRQAEAKAEIDKIALQEKKQTVLEKLGLTDEEAAALLA
jgi:hypothetical protein